MKTAVVMAVVSFALFCGACGRPIGESLGQKPGGAPAPAEEKPAPDQLPEDWRTGEVFERTPNSMGALPGSALTYVLPAAKAREDGGWLKEDDELYPIFQDKAARALELLTFEGKLVRDYMREDPAIREIWNKAVNRVRITRSRPQTDGTFHIVLQADLVKLSRRLSGN